MKKLQRQAEKVSRFSSSLAETTTWDLEDRHHLDKLIKPICIRFRSPDTEDYSPVEIEQATVPTNDSAPANSSTIANKNSHEKVKWLADFDSASTENFHCRTILRSRFHRLPHQTSSPTLWIATRVRHNQQPTPPFENNISRFHRFRSKTWILFSFDAPITKCFRKHFPLPLAR